MPLDDRMRFLLGADWCAGMAEDEPVTMRVLSVPDYLGGPDALLLAARLVDLATADKGEPPWTDAEWAAGRERLAKAIAHLGGIR